MSRTATASKKPQSRAASKDYLALVSELPIRPLRSEKDYKSAQQMLDRLVGREDLSPGEIDYIAGLARFVEDYEREHRLGQLRRLTPVELLRHLMEENDMSTTDLGYVLGSRGLASEVLNGKRGLSKMLIARLSKHFGLYPALFLEIDNGS